MRVSSNQYHITVNASLQNANSQLEKLMGQMASGNRMAVPSDDPIAHVRVSRLQREEASIAQYKDNIGALSTRMTQSEAVLTSINNDLMSTRDLLVWALDGANTSADLNAMATSLESLRDALVAGALTKDQEGSYMFSGTASKTPTVVKAPLLDADENPVLDEDGNAVEAYAAGGNDEQQLVVVGSGLTQPANVTIGRELAGALNLIDNAITILKQSDASANEADSRAVLTAALEGMDAAMDQVSTKISKLGGAQNIIATLSNNWSNLSIANQTAVLDYSSMDYTTGAVELQSLMSAIQATQSAYGKVSKLSLFDAL